MVGQAKTEEWVQSTKDTANEAKDRTASAAQSAKNRTTSAAQSAQESAQHGKDQSAGFLQQVLSHFILFFKGFYQIQ